MTVQADIYIDGDHWGTRTFEAVPRTGEFLYFEDQDYQVTSVWHDMTSPEQVQVDIDVTWTGFSRTRK